MRDMLFSVGFIAFAALFGHQARALVSKPAKATLSHKIAVMLP
jgi:hypothetical protein